MPRHSALTWPSSRFSYFPALPSPPNLLPSSLRCSLASLGRGQIRRFVSVQGHMKGSQKKCTTKCPTKRPDKTPHKMPHKTSRKVFITYINREWVPPRGLVTKMRGKVCGGGVGRFVGGAAEVLHTPSHAHPPYTPPCMPPHTQPHAFLCSARIPSDTRLAKCPMNASKHIASNGILLQHPRARSICKKKKNVGEQNGYKRGL